MLTIWKYPLTCPGERIHSVPANSQFLAAAFQDDQLYAWLLVNDEAEKVAQTFAVIGTGWEVPPLRTYAATVHKDNFVWHIFTNGQVM